MPISRDDTASRLDRVIAEARRQRDLREQSYRERALKLYPWVCGRCTREFRGRYRESLLGAFWAVASPLAMIVACNGQPITVESTMAGA